MKCYKPVDVIITEWALDSYLDMKHGGVFIRQEYKDRLRPDVELLRDDYPANVKFGQSKFWGPVTDKSHAPIPDAFKMKWHNVGGGQIQLRLLVAILHGTAYLCDAYNKNSDAVDKKFAATMKWRMTVIHAGRHTFRGKL